MTSSPIMVKSLTLVPGAVLSVPNLWTKPIIRIDQEEYDRFRITVGEQAAAAGSVIEIDINTRGYDRLPEPEPDYSTGTARRQMIENAASLPLEISDIVMIPELSPMQIGSILQIREGRYQIELIEKYQHSVLVDVLINSGEQD